MSIERAQPHRNATIEDVAGEAGVSVATVSRALRGLPNVATSTRRRVVGVAERLDYRPHPAATRLAAGRTRTITVAVPTINGWYFSTVVAGAEAVCAEAGYDVMVVGVGTPQDRSRLLHHDARLEHRADGLLLVDLALRPDEADSLHERGVSVATVGRRVRGVPSVCVDNVAVGRLATEHLLDLGHRRIGVIGGQQHDPMEFDVPGSRHRGHVDALGSAGLIEDSAYTAHGNFGVDGGQEAMAQLLDLDEPPSGVFAMSDEMAFGALRELRERRLEPGRDVSIVGVDDHEFARVVDLTTIRQHVAGHGATAARHLIRLITGGDDGVPRPPVDTAERIELIIRATTGPPPHDER